MLRIALRVVAALSALALGTSASLAQSWPSKPIQVIVPFTAGSATDIIPRTVLEQVSARLGQPIVVQNRPGAGSAIGVSLVARAEPDGYTLLATSNAIASAPAFQDDAGYDPLRDFAPIAMFGDVPLVLIISPDKHIRTVQELVAYAKAHPGALNYASGGIGSATHLPIERFRLAAGFTGQHIPFKGAPEAITEVMTGRVDVYFAPLPATLALIRAGKVLPLAVAGAKRTSVLPDVPTTLEAGYPNSDSDFWSGFFAPANTPPAIVNRLHDEVMKALEVPAVKQKLGKLGVEPMPMTRQEISALLAKEVPIAVTLAKASGVTAKK